MVVQSGCISYYFSELTRSYYFLSEFLKMSTGLKTQSSLLFDQKSFCYYNISTYTTLGTKTQY